MASFGENGVVHLRRLVLGWRKELCSIGLATMQQKDYIYPLASQSARRLFRSGKSVGQVSKVIAMEWAIVDHSPLARREERLDTLRSEPGC